MLEKLVLVAHTCYSSTGEAELPSQLSYLVSSRLVRDSDSKEKVEKIYGTKGMTL